MTLIAVAEMELEIVPQVTLLTRKCCMYTGQGEDALGVVEPVAKTPLERIVAEGTIDGQSSRHMVGIGGCKVVAPMASHALE